MTKITGSRNFLLNLAIILFFLVLSYAYMFPLLEGQVIEQSDISHFKGMARELQDYREETGKEAIWTNSMFSGMPGYLISVIYPDNLAKYIGGLPRRFFSSASFIFLYLIGFYILLSSLKIKRWLSIAGAIAFAFSSYFLIILAAGHNSKAVALSYLPIVLAGVLLVFNKKYIPGTILYSVGMSLEILAGHLQITYYGFILLAIYGIVELVYSLKEKAFQPFIKSVLFLLAGTVIAVGMNFSRLYTTYKYSKQTIRAPSELTSNNENQDNRPGQRLRGSVELRN